MSQELGRMVADDLFALEEALDSVIARTAKLQLSVTQARQDGNLSAGLIQHTMEQLSAITAGVTQARGVACDTHSHLAAIQRKVGLAGVAFGPFEDKPAEGLSRPLAAVA